MAVQKNIEESDLDESLGDVSLKQIGKSGSENSGGCCECNICLETAREPVVTLCGHLYCWPCIYKWLHIQPSSESSNQTKCPVCKSHISNSSLIPLYGRGSSSAESGSKRPHLDLIIPSRLAALGQMRQTNQQSHPNTSQPQPHLFPHELSSAHPLGSYAMTTISSPTVGMVGEIVCAIMFRSFDASMYAYPYGLYPNPYMGNGSPRMRRQVMQVEKSLNRVTIFLFCCFVLCLLLF